LVELLVVDFAGRFGHQVDCGGSLGESDDFANGLFTCQQHHHAIETESDAAMRRRAVRECVEKKTEAAPRLLLCESEGLEQSLLYVLTVNSNAPRTEFYAIQNQVVALGAHVPRRGFEFVQVLVDNSCEGMLGADPGFVGIAPLKKWKAGEPSKFPLGFVDDAKRFAKLQAQLTGYQRGCFRAFDFLLRGDCYDQVAGFCSAEFRDFLYVFGADQFLYGGSRAFRCDLYKISATRAG